MADMRRRMPERRLPLLIDPAVVKFNSRYWLYYSVPPYEGKPTAGWSIGVATSNNLVDWIKAGEFPNAYRLSPIRKSPYRIPAEDLEEFKKRRQTI